MVIFTYVTRFEIKFVPLQLNLSILNIKSTIRNSRSIREFPFLLLYYKQEMFSTQIHPAKSTMTAKEKTEALIL